MDKKYIAFTFDDAPSYPDLSDNPTASILDAFREVGGKATFFITGVSLEKNGDYIVNELLKRDFEIENHSYHHSNLTDATKEEITEEIFSLQRLVKDRFGVEMSYFRPAGLKDSPFMRETVKELGFPMIYGGYGASALNDWNKETPAVFIEKTCIENAHHGQIVLMHGHSIGTKACIHTILRTLSAQGYTFVTLHELFDLFGQTDLPCGVPIYDAELKLHY